MPHGRIRIWLGLRSRKGIARGHARDGWLLIVLAVGVVAVVAVVATVAVLVTTRHGVTPFIGRPNWTPPAQTLLASSMAKQPVPGWTVNLDGLGLPADSKIATSDDAAWSRPLVGTLDERAYFLAKTPDSSGTRWWLVGVDTRSGQKLFAPTELTVGADVPKCMTNGPATVLCLLDDVQNAVVVGSTAWVVDARTGAVTYTGPAGVHVTGDRSVHPVGIYAVATTDGEGVYGVGPSAEPTWFVPGDGRLPGSPTVDLATSPPTQATQGTGDPASEPQGGLLGGGWFGDHPDLSPQRSPRSAIVYPGGFAVHVEPAESTRPLPTASNSSTTGASTWGRRTSEVRFRPSLPDYRSSPQDPTRRYSAHVATNSPRFPATATPPRSWLARRSS